MSSAKLEVWIAQSGMAMATQGNLVVVILRDVVTLEMLRELRKQTERIIEKIGMVRLGLTIVEPAAVGDVSKEIRVQSAAMIRDFPQVAAATVIEGGGFKAIAARAIVSGMSLLARTRDGNRIFSSIGEAGAWLSEKHPERGALTKEKMAETVEATRKLIPAK